MISLFKRELKSNLKSLIFWSIGLFIMAAICFFEYAGVANSGDTTDAMFDMMPRVVKVMFGAGTLPLSSPDGYYSCMFFWLAIINFSHAILLGAGIVSKEETDKTSEFLFTKPINRKNIVTSKIFASIINIIVLTFISWFSTVAFFLPQVEEANLLSSVNTTMIGMFITQIIFFFLGLFISGLLKDSKKGSIYSTAVLLITYFISVFIEMSGKVDNLNFLSPFRYFNCVNVLDKGLESTYLILSAIIIITTGTLSYILWNKKDLNN